jgi:hypothetical protein
VVGLLDERNSQDFCWGIVCLELHSRRLKARHCLRHERLGLQASPEAVNQVVTEHGHQELPFEVFSKGIETGDMKLYGRVQKIRSTTKTEWKSSKLKQLFVPHELQILAIVWVDANLVESCLNVTVHGKWV